MENGHVRQPTGVSLLRGDITLGNIISWIVMLGTMGVMWGTLSQTVNQNSAANDRQDALLAVTQAAITDLKVAIADGNGDIRLMREAIQRIERVQSDALKQGQ